MKRFLVAIIVILMSTVAFAQDKMPQAGLVGPDVGIDIEQEIADAAFKTRVQHIYAYARTFSDADMAKAAVRTLAEQVGFYVGERGDDCMWIAGDEEIARAQTEKLPPGGGMSCSWGWCVTTPPGPNSECFVGSWSLLCYTFWPNETMACCGYIRLPGGGQGAPCGECYMLW